MKNKLLLTTILAGILFLSFMNGSLKPQVGLEIGNKAPAIDQPLLDGTPFHTDSLEGKMVLIDFWASFDAPSRVESAKKKQMLQMFQNQSFLNGKDFVIVSVSLDRFKTPLNQVIERDNLQELYHICSFEGRSSDLAKKFNATQSMTNYLVDGDGRIVAVADGMAEIEQTLARLQR